MNIVDVNDSKCDGYINRVNRETDVDAIYRNLWIATVIVLATATLDYVSQIGLCLCA